MKFTSVKKKFAIAAAAIAVLAVSVSAAVLLLSPSQVAERSGQPALASAFESAEAIEVNETKAVGDYNVTLQGLVSGKGLTDFTSDVDAAKTYAVLSIARRDGAPLSDVPFELAFSPMVGGYHIQSVNAWTLGGGWTAFAENGTVYYLFETASVEMFADHTVYFAVYEGMAPSQETFEMHEDGAITLREGVKGAMFTLPLDASKADPAAALAFVESTGTDWQPLTDEALSQIESRPIHVEQGKDGTYFIIDGDPIGENEAYTVEAFEQYVKEQKAKLAQELKDGVLSQESHDMAVQDLEDTLKGLKDGSLVVYPMENGYAAGSVNADDEYSVTYSAMTDGIQVTVQ